MKLPPIGKVCWFCGTNKGDAQDCVDWAERALVQGADSPSLLILAGLTPPLNDFEVKDYTSKALNELGLKVLVGDEAVVAYAKYLAAEIVKDSNAIERNLKQLFILCHTNDYLEEIYDFYLLHCALDDLKHSHDQHYWPGLNRSNLGEVVIARCREFTINR